MIETIKLHNGVSMPMEGFGVFQIPEADCEQVVTEAIKTGYRLIDTASSYQNEEAVGRAIRNCGIPRKELFITTKAYIQEMGYDRTIQAFERSLKKLGLDYLDLYLIHMPFGDYYGSWRAFACPLETIMGPGGRLKTSTGKGKYVLSGSVISCRTVCWICAAMPGSNLRSIRSSVTLITSVLRISS